jgi:hypothetical protein
MSFRKTFDFYKLSDVETLGVRCIITVLPVLFRILLNDLSECHVSVRLHIFTVYALSRLLHVPIRLIKEAVRANGSG